MRQFLAATTLLALLGLPAVYFLDAGTARTVTRTAVAGANAAGDPVDSAIASLQKVAAGLAGLDDGNVAAPLLVADATASAGAIYGRGAAVDTGTPIRTTTGRPMIRHALTAIDHDETPRRHVVAAAEATAEADVRHEPRAAAVATANLTDASVTVGNPAAYAPRYLRSASAPGVPRAAFDLAGSFPDSRGLPRSYPTTFAWFDLV